MAHRRGLECEIAVLRRFEKIGYELLVHRGRTPFGEIDLLLRDSKGVVFLVEVKSSRSAEFLEYRVSHQQRRRIYKIAEYLRQYLDEVQVLWAYVDSEMKVQVISDL